MNTLSQRREFLQWTSCLGAAALFARYFPLPALAQAVAQDPRVSAAPLLDRGFASVRKIGNGVYGTIADLSKGYEALSNGGFIVGRDSALLIEGHRLPVAAALEFDALRMVSQVPIHAAVDTHYHFDHSMGNSFYGARDIKVWAHARTAPLMVEKYADLQGRDKSAVLDPLQKRVRDARSEAERQHAQGDLQLYTTLFSTLDSAIVALPNVPLDPARLPMKVDLGGIQALIETYPGHSPTDIVVRVPEQNIVFTGDLLFSHYYPVTFDADISGWRSTLKRFSAFGKDALFVPGHGQICGQQGITDSSAIFDDLAAYSQKMYKAGVPPEEASRRYTVPPRFQDFPIFAWGFCIDSFLARFYQELKPAK